MIFKCCPNCGSDNIRMRYADVSLIDDHTLLQPPKISCLDCGFYVKGERIHHFGVTQIDLTNQDAVWRWNEWDVFLNGGYGERKKWHV